MKTRTKVKAGQTAVDWYFDEMEKMSWPIR
jgi:hypothetical protein